MRTAGVYNEETGEFEVRNFTEEELLEAEAQQLEPKIHNRPLLEALKALDAKTPRAMREALLTGDSSRVQALEAEAETLRSKLI